MYIIGSTTSDDEIPKITDEVKKYIETEAGIIEKHEEPGKKKLAYLIKKNRTGHYVLVNFDAPSDRLNEIEHKIRTNQNIIRHLITNVDEAMVRMEKDRIAQSKLRPRVKEEVKEKVVTKPERKIEIDLDAEIEKALESKDLK
jgi:small subunit ribosomal protein S6